MSKASGMNNASAELSNGMIGPLVGGFIVSSLEMSKFIFAIIITAISVTVALFISLLLKEPEIEDTCSEVSSLALLKDGVKLLRSNTFLQRIVFLSLFSSPFAGYFLALYQPYFIQSGVPAVWLGIAWSLSAVLVIMGSRYAYLLERHLGIKHSTFLATALPGVLYFFLAVVLHPIFSVVLFCLVRGSMSFGKPLFAHYQNVHIESKNRATVLSIITMFAGMYQALMGLVIGRIADYQLSAAFMFMGAISLLGACLFRINESHLIQKSI